MRTKVVAIACLIVGFVGGATAATFAPALLGGKGSHQPYRDEQGRPITSLSADDVRQLEAGEGWGLAKPAEFNGYPGPAHVLEFADQLDLADKQLATIQAIFGTMREEAKELGAKLIEAERALDAAFIDKTIDKEKLAWLLVDATSIRGTLRNVHLTAHLEVTPLLDAGQRETYDELRGYAGHTGH